MTESPQTPSRRDQILAALAGMLESHPGKHITTAALARAVGVSEAALYRHFPSKFKMFESLIGFAEEAIFTRVNQISAEAVPAAIQVQKILAVILNLAERNPGISRILAGEAITGEDERLRQRVAQLFERVETHLRQLLRQAEIAERQRPTVTITATANLLTAYAEGRIAQYVRTGFRKRPTEYWDEQWQLLSQGLLVPVPVLTG
ncbi:MAG: nucleoid occlusion factor SlmA [Methylococcaceae bacterium]|nr:nucleoid occlusion factor SlmA [Methylococcaceae bacterium]